MSRELAQKEGEQEPVSFQEILKMKPVGLLPEMSDYTKQQLKEMFPGKNLVVCDFNVAGLDLDADYERQIAKDGILNIDHHSKKPEMERKVSSTNLAIEYIKKYGLLSEDWQYIVHHTDCDSLLSSAIMRGILPPDEKFGEAAVAADHTGAENKIADLLQAIQDRRDLGYSLEQLQLLMAGEPLDGEAQKALEKRYADRARIKQLIENGGFKAAGSVSYAVLNEKIDGALVPALLPDSEVILLFSPLEVDSSKWEVKFRLGQNVSEGFSLKKLDIEAVDPFFGGRWNAGSNKRGGGTNLNPDDYAAKIVDLIKDYEGNFQI